MARRRTRSDTGRALGIVGLGTAIAVAMMFWAAHAMTSDGAPRASSSLSASTVPPGTGAPVPPSVTAPSEPEPTLATEGGFYGDAQQQSFYRWAASHRVGSLNLPGMDQGGSMLLDVATGYCRLLSEEPGGSGRDVTGIIRRQTGASWAEARELLERSVAAFCPQKVRHLV